MNIFKVILLIFCTILGEHCVGQDIKLHSIKIEYENFNTESVFAIDCDFFKTAFEKTVKTKIYDDKFTLSEMGHLKHKFKTKSKRMFDTRGKITFDYGTYSNQYCFDRYDIFRVKMDFFTIKDCRHF